MGNFRRSIPSYTSVRVSMAPEKAERPLKTLLIDLVRSALMACTTSSTCRLVTSLKLVLGCRMTPCIRAKRCPGL